MHYPDEKSFQAALQEFRQQGLSEQDIFSRFMLDIQHAVMPGTLEVQESPLKDFLVFNISNSLPFMYPNIGYAKWHEDRNLIYFHLLEQVREDLAVEYALDNVLRDPGDTVAYFITYRNGHYIPFITGDIKKTENYSKDVTASKFKVALHLYAANKNAYKNLLENTAGQYLRHFTTDKDKGWAALEELANFSPEALAVIKTMKVS